MPLLSEGARRLFVRPVEPELSLLRWKRWKHSGSEAEKHAFHRPPSDALWRVSLPDLLGNEFSIFAFEQPAFYAARWQASILRGDFVDGEPRV